MSGDTKSPKQMVGGCCVCSDERGWPENPLVYCDGDSCSVAVHQACYGIMQVPSGSWYCRKCESQERTARVRCDLCPNKDGALKRTETNTWAHVVCALYIPEVRFGNNLTMEPIVLRYVPPERFTKSCYICEQQGRRGDGGASGAASRLGACMNCNKPGCRMAFHVTCAQSRGLLCEEEGNSRDNVKYCGYCAAHYPRKLKKGDMDGDGSCDSADATGAGRTQKSDARNGPASLPSAAEAIINGVAEPSVIEAANCLADMRRYDVSANRSASEGLSNTAQPAAAIQSSSSVAASNGDWAGDGIVAVVGGHSVIPHGSDQSSHSKTDVAVGIASAVDGRSATPQSDVASPAESGRISAKPAQARRLGGQQQPRRRNSSAAAGARSSSREVPSPSSASSGGPTKSAKRQKLQRVPAGEAVPPAAPNRRGPTAAAVANSSLASASSSNGPPAASGNVVSPHRKAPPSSYESCSRDGTAGGEDLQQTPHRVPTAASPVPQSMQQLLEQQFEQGSQFLMEHAQYFDIASLLRCLAQMQAENKQLEETVRGLNARRDHLASVNARLTLPLGSAAALLPAAGAPSGTIGSPASVGAAAAALGPRQGLQPLSPRLSPRGPGDMPAVGPLPFMLQPAAGAAGPNVALLVAQPGVASMPGYVQTLAPSAHSSMDHHFHQQQQQQFMMQQQQQQQHLQHQQQQQHMQQQHLQHQQQQHLQQQQQQHLQQQHLQQHQLQQHQLQQMMFMAQTHHAGVPAAVMPPPSVVTGGSGAAVAAVAGAAGSIQPGLVAPGSMALNAGGGLIVPVPAAAAQQPIAVVAGGDYSSAVSGQSYAAPVAANHLHVLSAVLPANAVAAISVPSTAAVGGCGSGTASASAASAHSSAGPSSNGGGSSGGTFSPASTKLQKSDRKAS